MASDAPIPESQSQPTESTSLLPDWLTGETAKSVATEAATTAGLATLPGVGLVAAAGYAAYNAYNWLSGDSTNAGTTKPSDSGKNLTEQAGRKILEEVSQKPPKVTDSNHSLGGSLVAQPQKDVQLPAQPKEAGKEPAIAKSIVDAIKTLEIPKLPELSGTEKPQTKLSNPNPQPPEGSIIFKASGPAADGKSLVVQAIVEKPGLAGGGAPAAPEIRVQPAKSVEPNGYSTVSPAPIVRSETPKTETFAGKPAEQPSVLGKLIDLALPAVKPETPALTIKPETPVQPAKPETPVPPAKPETPVPQVKPETPVQPAKPETPAQQVKPETPAQPAKPETPVQPAKPETPVQPAKPETPVQPAKPETPVQPDKPETAVQPVKPETPTLTIKPETPAVAVKSADPVSQPPGGSRVAEQPAGTGGDNSKHGDPAISTPLPGTNPGRVQTYSDTGVNNGDRSLGVARANSGAPTADTSRNPQEPVSGLSGEQQGLVRKNAAESSPGVSSVLPDTAANAGSRRPGEQPDGYKSGTVEFGGRHLTVETRTGGASIPVQPKSAESHNAADTPPSGGTRTSPTAGATQLNPATPNQVGNPAGSPGKSGHDSAGSSTADALSKASASHGVMPMPTGPAQNNSEGGRESRCRGNGTTPPGDRPAGTSIGDAAAKNALSPEIPRVTNPDLSTLSNDQGRSVPLRVPGHERNISTGGESGTTRKAEVVTAQGAASVESAGRTIGGVRETSPAINTPGSVPNAVNPPTPGKSQTDATATDQSSTAGRLVGTMGAAGTNATATTGDAGRNCGGQRSDCVSRNTLPDGSVPTRVTDGINRPGVTDKGTDATSTTPGSAISTGIDRAARGQFPTDTASGADRTGTKLPGNNVIQDKPLDAAMPGGPKTSLESGRPSAELARAQQTAPETATQGDIQATTARFTDPALKGQEITRINQAIDRILASQPELRHATKDVALREIIKQLALEGLLPTATSALAPKALEVIKILLEQKLNPPQTQPSSQPGVAGQDPAQSPRVTSPSGGQLPGKISPLSQITDAAGLPLRPHTGTQNQSTPTGPANRGADASTTGMGPQQSAAGHQADGARGQQGTAPSRSGEPGGRDSIRPTGETPMGKSETGSAPGRAHEMLTSKSDASHSGSQSKASHTRFEGDKGRADGIRDHQAGDRSQAIRQNADDNSPGGRRNVAHQPDQTGHKPHGMPERDQLNTDKHGIDRKETTDKEGETKPHIRKGDHDGNRAGDGWIGAAVASLGGIAKSDDKKDNTDKRQPQADVRKQDRRSKYFVKFGDTLESIAEKVLGDKRFAELLITINRSLISFKFVGLVRVPDFREGQMIWLPTADEAHYHRRTFFGNSGITSGATTIPQTFSALAPTPSTNNNVSQQEAELLFVPPVLEIVDGSGSGVHAGCPTPAPIGQILYKIRFAGNKQALPMSALHPADLGYISRRSYVVRLGDTVRSIALRDAQMGDASLWILIARVNNLMTAVDPSGAPIVKLRRGQVIQLPNPNEIDQHKLLGKFAGIACLSQSTGQSRVLEAPMSKQPAAQSDQAKAQPAPLPVHPPAGVLPVPQPPQPQPSAGIEAVPLQEQPSAEIEAVPQQEQPSAEIEARMFIDRLAENCRILSADVPGESFVCSIKLQTEISGRWTTIASYDCGLNWAARYLYHPDGRRDHLDLDLPVSVVNEMAREDFLRNWESYARNYAQDGPQSKQRLA